ncbi:glutamic-type intramembrane protease PrsW [Lentibacillus juripiscarius]|uniref:Protease PrsW n=1 Tax=Lentibacillus juripiscarius TaxID=257446 RepID=A0ABW5VC49_9BACI
MLAVLTAAIAPALALLAFFYLKDKFTEPLSLIVKTFILGALLVFPIMFIQYGFSAENIGESNVIHSFFISGLTEEFFKWFIFIYVIFHHTEFDAHYDGIVYGVSISLGFATVENILYLFTNGMEYAFARALFPVSSHALFGVMAGYHFGKAKMAVRNRKWNIALALLLPFFLHGTYNYILASISSYWLLLLIPFMIGLWFAALRRVKHANERISINRDAKKIMP